MKKFILLTLALAVCMTVNAETYTWAVQAGWAWDTNIVWSPLDIANSNKYPNAKGDIAIVNTLVTNSAGNYQIWPNQFGHVFTTIGEFQLNMSNSLTFGTGPDFNAMVFQTDDPTAKIVFNNLDYVGWWDHTLDLRFDTSYILSNDLLLFAEGPVDTVGDKDSAVIWVVDDAQFFGDHSIIKEGEGRFIAGTPYTGGGYSAPDFKITKPIYINNGSFEPNHGAKFASPVYLQDGTNYSGFYRQYSYDDVDIDLVFNGGLYVANYTGMNDNTNHGDITVLAQADFLMSTFGGAIHHAVLDGDVRGTNWVVEWWDGDVFFAGSVSPGVGTNTPIGQLSFWSVETNSIRIGSPDRQVDLNIDVDGADSDVLVLESLLDFTLTNLNLKLNLSNADINATNLIVYSFDSGMNIGLFNSITWEPAGATGTIIYYPNAVEITDLQIPGEFTVNPNLVEFVTGETQKFVTLTSSYIATTTNTVIEGTNWISVAAQTVLASNSVPVAINIPVDQAIGSTGIVRFTSIELPSETYDVQIIVNPVSGEFTINTNFVEFVTGETQKFVTLTAPYITTTTNTVVEGTNWIAVAAQTFLASDSVDVAINIPVDQADGSTGTVRFTSIEMPTETYDVQITVIPEATTIGLIIFACMFSLSRGKRN